MMETVCPHGTNSAFNNVMTTRIRTLAGVFATATLIGLAGLLLAGDDASRQESGPIISAQIPKRGDIVVVPVTAGAKQFLFWVDTGSSLNFADTSLKRELGDYCRTVPFHTVIDQRFVECYKSPTLQVGKVNLPTSGEICCGDLAGIRAVTGREISAILGMDSLQHFIVQLDFDSGEIRCYSPDVAADGSWGERVDFTYGRKGIPEFGIAFDGVTFAFQIDTGNSGIDIDGQLNKWLLENNRLRILGKTIIRSTLGQDKGIAEYSLHELSVGPFHHNNVICTQGNGNRLGLSYLSRFVVTFDFPRRAMYLRKGQHYGDAEYANMSGLHILREDNAPTVHSADADSPAAVADIRAGDKILRVDDQDASQISLFDLRNLFKSGDGKKIRLTISRDGQELEKTLVLKEKPAKFADPVEK
jgi:hypothetical protein